MGVSYLTPFLTVRKATMEFEIKFLHIPRRWHVQCYVVIQHYLNGSVQLYGPYTQGSCRRFIERRRADPTHGDPRYFRYMKSKHELPLIVSEKEKKEWLSL